MKLVLATSNKGKVKEIKAMCDSFEVVPYTDLIDEFEIVEDGSSFKENALIKARAVFKALGDDEVVVLADDSGISVDAFGGEPGIYSARYAGVGASDVDNLNKMLNELKSKGLKSSPAHYTACMAIVDKTREFSVHGWMYGDVLDEKRGENGFGYDPIFVPKDYDKTLGELDDKIKKKLSHRAKALKNASSILKTF